MRARRLLLVSGALMLLLSSGAAGQRCTLDDTPLTCWRKFNSVAANAAKDKLTNFDDITTLISYSPVNRLFGRSIAPHVVFLDALEKVNPDVAAQLQKLGDALAKDGRHGNPGYEILGYYRRRAAERG